jgi:hypothetical protein
VLELASLPQWVRGTNGAGPVASVPGPVTGEEADDDSVNWQAFGLEGVPPPPLFSELHILKGFKSCVLKLRILQGLEARFRKCTL